MLVLVTLVYGARSDAQTPQSEAYYLSQAEAYAVCLQEAAADPKPFQCADSCYCGPEVCSNISGGANIGGCGGDKDTCGRCYRNKLGGGSCSVTYWFCGKGCNDVSDCDDGVYCNGQEDCQGVCVNQEPPTCEDASSCTEDRCDVDADVCVNEVTDPAQCTCTPAAYDEYVIEVGPESASLSGTCPAVGGSMGITAELRGTMATVDAHCGNGCLRQDSGEAQLVVGVDACNAAGRGISFPITGNASVSSQGCLTCDKASCEQGCIRDACVTNTEGASGGVSIERKLGFAKPVKGKVGALELNLLCAIKGQGGVTIGGSHTETAEYNDCVDCQTCNEHSFDFGANIGARGECGISGRVGPRQLSAVVEDGFVFDLSAEGNHILRSGECGDDYCASSKIVAKAQAKTPKLDLGSILWFEPLADYQCTYSLDSCTSSSSCGSCTCGGGECELTEVNASCAFSPRTEG